MVSFGWCTCNPEAAEQFSLRWGLREVTEFILLEQAGPTHTFGIVDLAIRRSGGELAYPSENHASIRTHSVAQDGTDITGMAGRVAEPLSSDDAESEIVNGK